MMSQMGRLFLERQMKNDDRRRKSLEQVRNLVDEAQCQLRYYEAGTDPVGGKCLGISRKLVSLQEEVYQAMELAYGLLPLSPQSGKFDAQIRCGGEGFWVNVTADLVVKPSCGLGCDLEWGVTYAMGGIGGFGQAEWYGELSDCKGGEWVVSPMWLSNDNEILFADGRMGSFRMTQLTIDKCEWAGRFTGIGELKQPTKENQDE